MNNRILDTIARALADDEEVTALDYDEARNILAAFEANRIALVELPEPTEAVTMQDCAGSGKPFKPGTLSRDGEVAKCSACGTNRYVRDDGSIEPHQVPVAAVVATEEEHHA
ncbi:hypothetical protein PBI_CHE8_83 [Mycobacterium phage Che8]|uniref:Uncharacterized protein n=1 Tax=Mycobacterium virus Che8 TaxID=205868 RepID=Q855C7_9CAUD|nr:hypothetical protein PBI_CHE8_83 [Mycobacterium phage Che8]AAN12481.1 hypothetical protein PBI_CHE8_83 [Mycobacterium phage Che8]